MDEAERYGKTAKPSTKYCEQSEQIKFLILIENVLVKALLYFILFVLLAFDNRAQQYKIFFKNK